MATKSYQSEDLRKVDLKKQDLNSIQEQISNLIKDCAKKPGTFNMAIMAEDLGTGESRLVCPCNGDLGIFPKIIAVLMENKNPLGHAIEAGIALYYSNNPEEFTRLKDMLSMME